MLTSIRLFCLCASLFICSLSPASGQSIILQSTTSTANSGLYDYLLPKFTNQTGIKVHVVAVGTGQALKNAENGDGDVVLVHSREDEEKFVSSGFGIERFDVMYNDFIIIGPVDDPAELKSSETSLEALSKIFNARTSFVSRGDNSGTHNREVQLWKDAGLDPTKFSGVWYLETGSGMGRALNIAVGKGAYTITDRATWLNFNNKQDFKILYQKDPKLINQYGIILVNPDKHPHTKQEFGQQFVDWMLSAEGQRLISEYNIAGQQLFFPNYNNTSN